MIFRIFSYILVFFLVRKEKRNVRQRNRGNDETRSCKKFIENTGLPKVLKSSFQVILMKECAK